MDFNKIQKQAEDFIKFLVNNSKEEDDDGTKKDVNNEDVDKRKLIDEVAGIMKDAGCDDEDIRTAIGKMEKIGYDKSETGKTDNENEDENEVKNKKVKNEDEIKNKKVKNEDEEYKKEYDDLKKDVKEDVENKCGKKGVDNSKTDFYGKMNEIYNSAVQHKEESTYITRADRLKAGVEYFSNKEE